MNLPVIFDIAIGLIFIYLTLSLLASEIQELIGTFLQWRAKHLKKSIEVLLSGGSETEQSEIDNAKFLVQELYKDPLINTLNHQAKENIEKGFRNITENFGQKKSLGPKQSAPSYIPSETFAITLLEALKIPELIKHVKNPSDELKTNLYMILASYKELKTGINDTKSPSYEKIKNIYGNIDNTFIELVNKLPGDIPDNLITSLQVLAQRSMIKIDDITEEMNQFKKEVETWFDRSMDRASGVYKRNAKGVAILIGISVAILTNTDTFHLLYRLSQDSAMRSALTQNVSQRVEIYYDKSARKQFEKTLWESSVPIGWQNISQQFEPLDINKWNIANDLLLTIWLVLKLTCGWIVSGFAIAMGAPFWFDILNKVVNVRNAGPKPVAYTRDQPPSK